MALTGSSYSPRRMRAFIIFLVLIITIPSNLYILASLAVTALSHPYPFFHERAENEAIDWLARETGPPDTVLAAYGTGSYIPSRINHRVFVGYWAETAECEAKIAMLDRFFQAETPDSWRIGLLDEHNIAYLFYGPREKAVCGFEPKHEPYLVEVYANLEVSIYEVHLESQGCR